MEELTVKGKTFGAGRPLVCVPVMEQKKENIIREITYLAQSVADMIEWRVDAFENFSDCNAVRDVLEAAAPVLGEKIFLYTFRSRQQGGLAEADAATLDDLHELAAESGCVDFVDMEFFAEDSPVRTIHKMHTMGMKVIASHHDFEQTPSPDVMKMLLERMCEGGADIVKLAVMPQNQEDVLHLLGITAAFRKENKDTPVITMAMGSLGCVSRLCGENFGSCVTFGSHEKPSAPGQFEMNELYQMLQTIHERNINGK
jgi:3-dehydroquinate dehydratase-1